MGPLVDSAPGIGRDKSSEGPQVQLRPQSFSPDKVLKNMSHRKNFLKITKLERNQTIIIDIWYKE